MSTVCLLPKKLGLGGPASFQARLAEALKQQKINVVFDPDDAAVTAILVVGGTRRFDELIRARRRGVRIVQRLNGMNWVHKQKYTGVRHYVRAEYGNWILSTIRRSLADRIVYQSQFTQNWWLRAYGPVKAPCTVIYNGVNLDQYSPLGASARPTDHYRMLLVEGHLGGGYEQGLLTAVKAAEMLNQRLDKPVELMVAGESSTALQRQACSDQINVIWRGVVKRDDIPEIDRSAHFLFSADINAACPNSVIEALACGLPVVGYDTGALPELLANGAGCVASYGGDPWKLETPQLSPLVEAAQTVLKSDTEYQKAARKQAEAFFDIQAIASSYRKILLDE
jgi:glycosyltransferase involved in cell wall biosynthesis